MADKATVTRNRNGSFHVDFSTDKTETQPSGADTNGHGITISHMTMTAKQAQAIADAVKDAGPAR